MSEFEEFAEGFAGPALMEWHGKPQSVKFKPTGGTPFTVDAILGLIRGQTEFADIGQERRLLSAAVHVRTSDLIANGISELPATARIDAYGMENWTIRLAESEWGQTWVKLTIERETLVREYQARRNAAV